MIVLDTCTAINCFNFSKVWTNKINEKCPSKIILWETQINRELNGLSRSTRKYVDYIKRLDDSANVQSFDIDNDLSDDDYTEYIEYLDQIGKNDSVLLYDDLKNKNQTFKLDELQDNGKKRLSDIDKSIIALSLTINNSILATDDNRILKLVETFFTSQNFCCTSKIIEKANNINCNTTLRQKLINKNIKFYSQRFNSNTIAIC